MTMFKAMMVALVLSIVSAANGAELKPALDITPADRPAVAVEKKEEPKAEAPEAKEEKEEFAGTTMIRFFAKSLEAAKDCRAKNGLAGSESIQIAAY